MISQYDCERDYELISSGARFAYARLVFPSTVLPVIGSITSSCEEISRVSMVWRVHSPHICVQLCVWRSVMYISNDVLFQSLLGIATADFYIQVLTFVYVLCFPFFPFMPMPASDGSVCMGAMSSVVPSANGCADHIFQVKIILMNTVPVIIRGVSEDSNKWP